MQEYQETKIEYTKRQLLNAVNFYLNSPNIKNIKDCGAGFYEKKGLLADFVDYLFCSSPNQEKDRTLDKIDIGL